MSDSFCSPFLSSNNVLPFRCLYFLFCFPLEGNAELKSLVSFEFNYYINYIFCCLAVCDEGLR